MPLFVWLGLNGPRQRGIERHRPCSHSSGSAEVVVGGARRVRPSSIPGDVRSGPGAAAVELAEFPPVQTTAAVSIS